MSKEIGYGQKFYDKHRTRVKDMLVLNEKMSYGEIATILSKEGLTSVTGAPLGDSMVSGIAKSMGINRKLVGTKAKIQRTVTKTVNDSNELTQLIEIVLASKIDAEKKLELVKALTK